MRIHRYGLLALLLAFGVASPLAAQDPDPVRLTLSGYAQFQFNTTSIGVGDIDPAGNFPASTFETRRVRLYADVALNSWITGRIQPEFAMGNLRLFDLFMNFNIDPRFQLRAGQFKRPFNRFFIIGAPQHMAIESGVRIREYDKAMARSLGDGPHPYTNVNGRHIHGEEYQLLNTMGLVGHDMGVAAHGRLGRASYQFALLNGSGQDAHANTDGKSFIARVDYTPLKDLPLTVSAAASHRKTYFNGTLDGVATGGRDLSGNAFGLDLEWGRFRRSGVHLLAALTTGDNLYADERFLAAQGIVAYFQPLGGARIEGIEFVGRASYGDPNVSRSEDQAVLITPGINLYFSASNRLMVNWDTYISGIDRVAKAHAFRIQTQFAFGIPIPSPASVATVSSQD